MYQLQYVVHPGTRGEHSFSMAQAPSRHVALSNTRVHMFCSRVLQYVAILYLL